MSHVPADNQVVGVVAQWLHEITHDIEGTARVDYDSYAKRLDRAEEIINAARIEIELTNAWAMPREPRVDFVESLRQAIKAMAVKALTEHASTTDDAAIARSLKNDGLDQDMINWVLA